jgi:hypothetical protein
MQCVKNIYKYYIAYRLVTSADRSQAKQSPTTDPQQRRIH